MSSRLLCLPSCQFPDPRIQSGTGALTDNAQGDFAGGILYSDLDVPTIESIPDSNPHRHVDTAIVAADKEGAIPVVSFFHPLTHETSGYVKTYIVLPSTVWGIADNAFTAKGLQKPNSIQIPWIINTSISRGTPMNVGSGVNLWPQIHITDSLYHSS